MPGEPHQRRQTRDGGDVHPAEGVPGAHLPQRVDHRQIRRPQQLAHVEPQRVRRDQHPLHRRVAERERLARGVEREVGGGDGEPAREQRCEAEPVGRGHRAPLPPVPDDERRGQGDRDRLRQQRGREQTEHQAVACGPRRLGEPDPGEHRAQVEQRGEQVLALDDPGHRLDVQGMHGEHRGERPGAGHRETQRDAPHQQRVDQVQHQVDEVVAERRQPPQLVLQPEGGIDDRPVVAFVPDVGRRKPDVPQAGPSMDDRLLGEDHVVPDEAPRERREVAGRDEERERRDAGDGAARGLDG